MATHHGTAICHARQHDHYDAHPRSGDAIEGATVGRYGTQGGVFRAQLSSNENASSGFDDVSGIVLIRYSAGCVFGMLWRVSRVSPDCAQRIAIARPTRPTSG
ncbi:MULTISPECIES: hypothetical protein [Mycetohabitans]|uniref:hypothetical protein n=1 Tax=Mycetohabitans TaxID=2571159 RepID=UPI0002D46AAD|nr:MULTISPECIES: hypothetical protein [Mycetohabitans]MCG1048249.1 hypothetical protein [Mycetohabitans sp. B6]